MTRVRADEPRRAALPSPENRLSLRRGVTPGCAGGSAVLVVPWNGAERLGNAVRDNPSCEKSQRVRRGRFPLRSSPGVECPGW